jgi:uncharacterized protein YeaO (DUF488 family)
MSEARKGRKAIRLKRAYEPPEPDDGFRILVDRLWPRGVAKKDARIDLWMKEIAPSTELRKWFSHDPEKWDGFRDRYFRELDGNSGLVEILRSQLDEGPVTLVFGARDEEHNDAVALREYLRERKPR